MKITLDGPITEVQRMLRSATDYVAQDYSPRLRSRNCVIYTYGTGQPAHAVWGTQDNVKVRCERKCATRCSWVGCSG